MAGDLKLKAGSSVTLEASGGALANNTAVEANDATIDNDTALNTLASFELVTGFGSAPVVGVNVDLYLIPRLDGTNYGESDVTTPTLSPTTFVGSFSVVKAQTGVQRLTLEGVSLSATRYKAFLWNRSGQQMSAAWTLKVFPELEQYT